MRRNMSVRLAVAVAIAAFSGLAVIGTRLFAADDAPKKYYRVENGQVDKSTYLGWWTFHVTCYECHGWDATGSDVAPDLTDSIKRLSPVEFTTKVLTRYHITLPDVEATAESQRALQEAIIQEVLRQERGEHGAIVMPAWEPDFRVKPHVMDLYAYLQARGDGVLKAGKPELLPGEFLWQEKKQPAEATQ